MAYERLGIPRDRHGWVMEYRPAEMGTGSQVHAHRELEINLVVKGRGSYLIQGGKYPIRSGALLWLFPDQPHLLVEASADFTMWVAVFRPRLVSHLTQEAPADVQILRSSDPGRVYVQELRADSIAFLETLFRRLAKFPPGDHPHFNGGLGFLLRTAWEAGRMVEPLPSVANVHPAVERALHLLKEGAEEGSLVELASKAGMSYSRLCTLFTRQTGQTLGDFRNRMRVQRLQELVTSGSSRTLLDLALEAGFGSYAQCHRMVVKHTGQSPARLR